MIGIETGESGRGDSEGEVLGDSDEMSGGFISVCCISLLRSLAQVLYSIFIACSLFLLCFPGGMF
jgi:hypothetical protein